MFLAGAKEVYLPTLEGVRGDAGSFPVDAKVLTSPGQADDFAQHLAAERNSSTHTVRAYVTDVVSLLDHATRMGATRPGEVDLRYYYIHLGAVIDSTRYWQTFRYCASCAEGAHEALRHRKRTAWMWEGRALVLFVWVPTLVFVFLLMGVLVATGGLDALKEQELAAKQAIAAISGLVGEIGLGREHRPFRRLHLDVVVPRATGIDRRQCQLCKRHSGCGSSNLMRTSFFLSRQTLISAPRPGMAVWREHLFSWMLRNAQSAMEFFKLPTNRVVVGTQADADQDVPGRHARALRRAPPRSGARFRRCVRTEAGPLRASPARGLSRGAAPSP